MELERIKLDRAHVEKQFRAVTGCRVWIISCLRESSFTDRTGLRDVVFHREVRNDERCGICMERRGTLFSIAAVMARESGLLIRSYNTISADFNIGVLQRHGILPGHLIVPQGIHCSWAREDRQGRLNSTWRYLDKDGYALLEFSFLDMDVIHCQYDPGEMASNCFEHGQVGQIIKAKIRGYIRSGNMVKSPYANPGRWNVAI
jgi:hypothetical protein